MKFSSYKFYFATVKYHFYCKWERERRESKRFSIFFSLLSWAAMVLVKPNGMLFRSRWFWPFELLKNFVHQSWNKTSNRALHKHWRVDAGAIVAVIRKSRRMLERFFLWVSIFIKSLRKTSTTLLCSFFFSLCVHIVCLVHFGGRLETAFQAQDD